METLKYKVINSDEQYFNYCKKLEELVFGIRSKAIDDEIDLLTLLIEKYDDGHSTPLDDIDPIQMLKSFMDDHKMQAKDVAELLGISKGLMSDILNYKKGLSKKSIRILADRFKVRQDAFNQPYILKGLLPVSDKKTPSLITRKFKMAG